MLLSLDTTTQRERDGRRKTERGLKGGCPPLRRSMNYNQARAKYWKKRLENPLPRLPEDERIYLNVTYATRSYAKYSHCGFDADKKLWFTGCLNANLYFLVDLYGVNKATSERALALMKAKLDEIDDKIEKIKQKPKSKEDHFNVDK